MLRRLAPLALCVLMLFVGCGRQPVNYRLGGPPTSAHCEAYAGALNTRSHSDVGWLPYCPNGPALLIQTLREGRQETDLARLSLLALQLGDLHTRAVLDASLEMLTDSSASDHVRTTAVLVLSAVIVGVHTVGDVSRADMFTVTLGEGQCVLNARGASGFARYENLPRNTDERVAHALERVRDNPTASLQLRRLVACVRTGLPWVADRGRAAPVGVPVRWDATAKVYWVAVRVEDGSIRQMRVEPANRAVATLRLEQIDRGDVVDYRYRVGADSSSPKTVSQIAVPCPSDGGITSRTGGDWQSMVEWRGTLHCEFAVYAARGQGHVDFALRSTLLAGVGEAVVVGASGVPVWPTEDPTEETIALGALVDSLSGAPPNGLVGRMPAPVPMYERRVVAQTDSGLQILAHELRRICAGTRWIPDPATCTQLEQRVPKRAEVPRQLDEFIRLLSQQRDVSVDQNAFTILHGIASAVRTALVPAWL